jgi:hypothetical protein
MSTLISAADYHHAQTGQNTTPAPAEPAMGEIVAPFETDALHHLWTSELHPVISDLTIATGSTAGPNGGRIHIPGPTAPGPGTAQQPPRHSPVSETIKTGGHKLRRLFGA